VVASNHGGSSEVVLDGQTGYIVNLFNTEELAVKISELLLDSKKAVLFGYAGRRRVEQHFLLEKKAEAYLRLFLDLR
jgi:glycosyltransferase involved in cell wall biosynthesis